MEITSGKREEEDKGHKKEMIIFEAQTGSSWSFGDDVREHHGSSGGL